MEYKDLLAIAELTMADLNLPKQSLKRFSLKDTRQGRWIRGGITIPTWILKESEQFQTYYVIHEVCHFIYLGHGPLFKEVERKMCKRWDIEIEYAKAYPKKLYANGQMVYNSKRK
jgi:predicted metal-dependent hydrolase